MRTSSNRTKTFPEAAPFSRTCLTSFTANLSDPSLGNRTFSREQFLEMWETRNDVQANAELKGKILAVLPNKATIAQRADYFSRVPKRQTAQAVPLQSIRLVP